MTTVHVFDFLAAPHDHPPDEICVLFGDSDFLRRLAMAQIEIAANVDEDTPFTTFDGEVAEWRDVADEVSTVSLFGGGSRRLAVVENADKLVSDFRGKLEDYFSSPSPTGMLVLQVKSWAANTRLYKSGNKNGLQIQCGPPVKPKGKKPDLKAIAKWLVSRANSEHRFRLKGPAAEMLIELVGIEFGLLEQSLIKLALHTGDNGDADADMVRDVVGGWKTKTAWDMLDAAVDGNAAEALLQLDRLIQANESPFAIFGQIAATLRRYAAVVRRYHEAEITGQKLSLNNVLLEAGFVRWKLAEAERSLKQLGRDRVGQFHRWILDADLALKGTHSHDDRARWIVESLILRMARRGR